MRSSSGWSGRRSRRQWVFCGEYWCNRRAALRSRHDTRLADGRALEATRYDQGARGDGSKGMEAVWATPGTTTRALLVGAGASEDEGECSEDKSVAAAVLSPPLHPPAHWLGRAYVSAPLQAAVAGWPRQRTVSLPPPPPHRQPATLIATMPPMAFTGLVTKVGFMNKTATVTVSRFVTHPKVGKVCPSLLVSRTI